jgi:hypothetical protein
MIGGTVTQTVEFKDKIRIDVVCDQGKDKLSVCVELTPAARCIERDDSIWWHSEYVLWSTKNRDLLRDYKLKKIGFSFPTPGIKKETEETRPVKITNEE